MSVLGATLSSIPAEYGFSERTALGPTGLRLEVAQRVDRRPVDPHLEVQVRAEAVARAADVADQLSLCDLRARADGEGRLVGVAGRHPAAMVDTGVVAVAADPACKDDRPGRGSVDRRSVGDADVDSGV